MTVGALWSIAAVRKKVICWDAKQRPASTSPVERNRTGGAFEAVIGPMLSEFRYLSFRQYFRHLPSECLPLRICPDFIRCFVHG